MSPLSTTESLHFTLGETKINTSGFLQQFLEQKVEVSSAEKQVTNNWLNLVSSLSITVIVTKGIKTTERKNNNKTTKP